MFRPATSRSGGIPIRVPLILLAVALALAGCLGGNDPVESASVSNDSASKAAETIAPDAAAPIAPVENVTKAFPFSFEGTTGTWACVPSGPNSCTGLPAGTPSSHTFEGLVYAGSPSAVDATLTWAAATPATEQMYVAVFAARSCGDSCIEIGEESYRTFAAGPSPLVLAAPDVKLQPDEALYVHVGVASPTPSPPDPIYFGYGIDQAFSLEGAVTASVAPS